MIVGLAVPKNVEGIALTQFLNEACDAATVRGSHYRKLPTEYVDTRVMNIKDYLARPDILVSGPLTNTSRSVVVSIPIGMQNFFASFPNFNRLSGTYGFRAKICFRLQVVATPFQSGRLRMTWLPHSTTANLYQNGNFPNFNSNFSSQLPGVELDIADTTTVDLCVPWVNLLDYLPYNFSASSTVAFPCDFGQMTLFAYLPILSGTGGGNPTYTLWWWLEDVDTIAAVPDNMVMLTPQSGISPADEEARLGKISGPLAYASAVVSMLARGIPSISSYAYPLSWALRASSGLAAAFGWSKPRNQNAVERVIRTNNIYQNNCDGADTAFSLSMFSDNHVQALTGFAGSDADEMSLAFVLGQFACISNFSLTPSDTQATLKYACNLSPSAMCYQAKSNWITSFPVGTNVPLASVKALLTSPAFYVGTAFNLWRGTFKFRIKVAKTKFHTGRLLVGYTPQFTTDFATSTTQFLAPRVISSPLAFKSVIWDLREGSTLEFECPFLVPVAYLNVNESCGNFTIQVLDPLIAPSQVAPILFFAVEVACCPDFEFAVPRTPLLFPSDPSCSATYGFTAQSGFQPFATPSTDVASFAIGEKILSLKQLISRACGLNPLFSNANTPGGSTYLHFWALRNAVLTTAAAYDMSTIGYANYFSKMYLFVRGSTTYDIIPNNDTTISVYNHLRSVSSSASGILCETTAPTHVNLPYYSATTRSLVSPASNSNYQVTFSKLNVSFAGRTAANVGSARVFMRAGDDAQLGYFLGSPPLDIPTDASTNVINYWFNINGIVPAS